MKPAAVDLVRLARPGDRLELSLTAEDLQALAQAYLDRKDEFDVREVGVDIDAPHVIIRGVTALLGRDFQITVSGRPIAQDGIVRPNLQWVELNGGPAPKFAVKEISEFLQRKLRSPKLLLDVEQVEVREQAVHLTGFRRPDPA